MQQYYVPPGEVFFIPGEWYPWSPIPYDPLPPPSPVSLSSGGGVSRASILTPAIVASIALLGSAILLVSYYKVFAKYCSAWQHFWGLSNRGPDPHDLSDSMHGAGGDPEQGWLLAMNTGLDEAIVKRIPIYVYRIGGEGLIASTECVVCLGEFEQDDELRILPKCSHAFHLRCIDVWLRSHSNCPLCRAPVVVPDHTPPLLLTPPIQAMSSSGELDQDQEQEHDDDDNLGRETGDHQEAGKQGTIALQRSLSLQLDCPRTKSATRSGLFPTILRRSHSTGSSQLSYHDLLLLTYAPPSSSPLPPLSWPRDSGLLLAPNNSAELSSTIVCDLREHDHEPEYVVLNIQVVEASSPGIIFGSSSSSSDRFDDNARSLLSVRKSGSFKASLRRSLSDRVFSFRRFARSRSQA